ncbi:MAG: primosomal protein N' [Dysgonamonadaceae bacterium]|jgi:primosomal protein N' (replication factor Y)|nr:primosomal protein N' [Dysgonamonadaceae bacterium]
MFAEIILPVPLSDAYTYSVPPEMESKIRIGSLVRVSFGRTKEYWGVATSISGGAPDSQYQIKPLLEIEEGTAPVTELQIRFWRWLSEYYICSLGEVCRAALPFSLTSEKPPLSKKRRKKAEAKQQTLIPPNPLSALQQTAFEQIKDSFLSKDVCLLHGVTASGKTEIYINLINETLKSGRQALYLLPEIALTAQITDRLRAFFGSRMDVYHSRITEAAREEIWKKLREDGSPRLILGVRSSLFLPFSDLGLVIVDEEHEPSYKQQDPVPRYNARNAAAVLARFHNAKTLLGSATPSIESYHNAMSGKYGYVRLDRRFLETELPSVYPVDVKELRRKKKMKGLFSPLLKEKMEQVLQRGEQILLFHNRRGFSQTLACKQCEWTPRCRYCDVSLWYHKQTNRLICHYCGRTYQIPKTCPECGSDELKPWGFGTEKVEEEIRKLFPQAAVERMDSDTTKKRHTADDIISRFENGETQILVGTQMTAKGLDFGNLSLVAILNADSLMNLPDFRAYERAFQLISQVAGRAGRRKTRGEVVLQTSDPEHPLIQMALANDYEAMYGRQSEERRLFRYPPWFRIIFIDLKHSKENIVSDAANRFAQILRISLGDRVLGPDKPPVGRVKNQSIRRIMLKIETGASTVQLRNLLKQTQNNLLANVAFRYVSFRYDVDPL